MSERGCCDIDAESLEELFETTVEVPAAVVLAAGCGCCGCGGGARGRRHPAAAGCWCC